MDVLFESELWTSMLYMFSLVGASQPADVLPLVTAVGLNTAH